MAAALLLQGRFNGTLLVKIESHFIPPSAQPLLLLDKEDLG
jgi:hypothetical protein